MNKQVEESKEKAAATKIEKAKTAGEVLEALIANHAAGKTDRTIKSRGIALCAAVQGGPANNRPDALLMKSKMETVAAVCGSTKPLAPKG